MSRGGAREGAGRPPKPENEKSQRKQRQIRAYDDEWQLIREFAGIVKEDRERAIRILTQD